MKQSTQIQIIVRLELHITSTLQGCKLLEEAEALLLENPELQMQQILRQLAKQHGNSPKGIEAQMQKAISHAYTRCGWQEFFPDHPQEPSAWEVLQKIHELLQAQNCV